MPDEVVRVLVASTNPVKLEAARIGLQPYVNGRLVVSGMTTPSRVSDQPYGDEETLRGARNRLAALCRGTEKADVYVAFEGGVFKTEDGRLHVAAWVCVTMHGHDYVSEARTATFQVPPPVQRLMEEEGLELGHADDKVFGRVDSGRSEGTVGILTSGRLCRDRYYAHALELAMIPFVNSHLWKLSASSKIIPNNHAFVIEGRGDINGIVRGSNLRPPLSLQFCTMSAVHKGKKAVQANGQLRYSAKHMVTGALVDACVDARWDFSIATVLAKLVSAREKDDPESLKLTSIYMAMLLLVPQQNRSVFSCKAVQDELAKEWYHSNTRECIRASANKLINVWKVDTVVGKGTDEGGHCIKPARLVITVPDLVWLADAVEQYLYDEYGADTGDYRLNLKKIVDPLKHLVEQDHGSTITREKIINIASDRDETKAREFLQQVGNSIDTRKREREHEESIREAKQLRAALDARYNHVGGEHDVCPSCGLAGQVRYRFLEGYDQSDCRKTEVWGGSTEMHSTGPRKEAKCANCDNVWTFDD